MKVAPAPIDAEVQLALLKSRAETFASKGLWDLKTYALQNGLRAVVSSAACNRDLSVASDQKFEALYVILNGVNLYGQTPFDLAAQTGLAALLRTTAHVLSRAMGQTAALETIQSFKNHKPKAPSTLPSLFSGGSVLKQHMISVAETLTNAGVESALSQILRYCKQKPGLIEEVLISVKQDALGTLSKYPDLFLTEMCLPRRIDAFRAAIRDLVVLKILMCSSEDEVVQACSSASEARWYSYVESTPMATHNPYDFTWALMSCESTEELLNVLNSDPS